MMGNGNESLQDPEGGCSPWAVGEYVASPDSEMSIITL